MNVAFPVAAERSKCALKFPDFFKKGIDEPPKVFTFGGSLHLGAGNERLKACTPISFTLFSISAFHP